MSAPKKRLEKRVRGCGDIFHHSLPVAILCYCPVRDHLPWKRNVWQRRDRFSRDGDGRQGGNRCGIDAKWHKGTSWFPHEIHDIRIKLINTACLNEDDSLFPGPSSVTHRSWWSCPRIPTSLLFGLSQLGQRCGRSIMRQVPIHPSGRQLEVADGLHRYPTGRHEKPKVRGLRAHPGEAQHRPDPDAACTRTQQERLNGPGVTA
jgi:hypothetical protein